MPPKKTTNVSQSTGPLEINISVSYGVKANLGNYESADAHVSKSEKWSTEGMTLEESDALYQERFAALRAEMSEIIENEYSDFTN